MKQIGTLLIWNVRTASVSNALSSFSPQGFQKVIFFGTPIPLSFPWINPIHLVSLILNVISSERPSLNPRPNQMPWYTLKWYPALFPLHHLQEFMFTGMTAYKACESCRSGVMFKTLLCSKPRCRIWASLFSKTLKAGHNLAVGYNTKATGG